MGYYTTYSLYIANEYGEPIKTTHLVKTEEKMFHNLARLDSLQAITALELKKQLGRDCIKELEDLLSLKIEFLKKLDGQDWYQYMLDIYINPRGGVDPQKWYEHEQYLFTLSKLFPAVLFRLEGEGEENTDQWIKWFKNGKMQVSKAVITFAPFNPREMK